MCLHGPAFVHYRRRAGDLPVLVHVVSQRARVLRLRRTGQPLASNAAAVLPSSYSSGSRHPDLAFFEAQSPRPPMPRSTLRNTPRDVPRKTRGQDGVAFSFPVGFLHPLQHAGLSRRTTGNALLVEVNRRGPQVRFHLPTIGSQDPQFLDLSDFRTPPPCPTVAGVSAAFQSRARRWHSCLSHAAKRS